MLLSVVVRLVFPLLPTFACISQSVYEAQSDVFRLCQAEDSLLSPFGQEQESYSLAEEGHAASGVYQFIQCCEETGTIAHAPGSDQTWKKITEAKRIIEDQMKKNDETLGKELQKLLTKNDISVASATALK